MSEPRDLTEARRRLAEAEAGYRSERGLARLADGLALLDDVIESGDVPHARTARNLAAAYAERICAGIDRALAGDRAVPEPELEHLFRVLLVFDRASVELPPEAADVKVELVRRLIDRYCEGHPPEHKQRALEELERLARGD